MPLPSAWSLRYVSDLRPDPESRGVGSLYRARYCDLRRGRLIGEDPLGFGCGDYLEIEVRDNRLILTPKSLIEKRLAEGLDDLKRGRTYGPFASGRTLIRSLRHEARNRKKR
jgi:hypothetical protein